MVLINALIASESRTFFDFGKSIVQPDGVLLASMGRGVFERQRQETQPSTVISIDSVSHVGHMGPGMQEVFAFSKLVFYGRSP